MYTHDLVMFKSILAQVGSGLLALGPAVGQAGWVGVPVARCNKQNDHLSEDQGCALLFLRCDGA